MNLGKFNIDKSFLLKRILPVISGAVLGYAYYFYVGCRTGSCPISGNPFVSTIYGAMVGIIVSYPGKENKNKSESK